MNIYIDVNGQWVSGYPDAEIEWALSQQKTGDDDVEGLKTWIVGKTNEITFGEYNDHSEWGQLHFTAPDDAQHQSGHAEELRQRFAKTGTLQDENDENAPRKINDTEPVFAFSKSFKLGNTDGPRRASVLFTISHVQREVTQFASAVGLTRMRPLWLHWFQTEEELIRFHYLDFSHATSLSANYSEQLQIDAHAFGGDSYVDIVALSARQALGATSFSGTPEDPKLFLKEISSNGNSQTVDVIFPSFPFFLYTQPRWAAYLLEPLLEHQLAYLYPNNYSMHDLGTHFPNMTGHADGKDEYMPVEECGDMLIMALSLVNAMTHESASSAQSMWSTTGHEDTSNVEADHLFPLTNLGTHNAISYIDPSFGGSHKGRAQAKKWVNRSYRLWKQWVAYLDEFARDPENQRKPISPSLHQTPPSNMPSLLPIPSNTPPVSTDDFAGWLPLQTNLALKGILGIKAFAHLALLTSHTLDASLHFTTATSYLAHWLDRGMSPDGSRAKLSYAWNGSWTTLYSLYSDAALGFHPSVASPCSASFGEGEDEGEDEGEEDFVPHGIYTAQSTWYASSLQTYGLPLDSRHLYAKSDWEMFAAAVAGEEVRREIIERVARWVNETGAGRPFVDLYETEEGGFPGDVRFYARPVVGGHFAGVALRGCGGREVEKKVEEMDEL